MGTRWAVQFLTEDAAWMRIVSLHNRPDTQGVRAQLMREGWRVSEVTSAPEQSINWSDRM